MLRPHLTIKAAFLAGFMVIFTVWLTSVYYITGHLTESQARSAAIHARFLRGQELLFTVQNHVLLGSIYVRDVLTDANEQSATVARDQLRDLQAQVALELKQYESIDSAVDDAIWRRLEDELRNYWQAVVRLTARESADRAATAQTLLRTQVMPKRDVIIQISDEIRQVIAGDFSREEQAPQ